MAFFAQLKLLLWKNFKLRRHHKLQTVMEVCAPLLLLTLLILARQATKPIFHEPCSFQPRISPTAGVIPWLQSFMCALENKCGRFSDNPDAFTGVLGVRIDNWSGQNVFDYRSLLKFVTDGTYILLNHSKSLNDSLKPLLLAPADLDTALQAMFQGGGNISGFTTFVKGLATLPKSHNTVVKMFEFVENSKFASFLENWFQNFRKFSKQAEHQNQKLLSRLISFATCGTFDRGFKVLPQFPSEHREPLVFTGDGNLCEQAFNVTKEEACYRHFAKATRGYHDQAMSVFRGIIVLSSTEKGTKPILEAIKGDLENWLNDAQMFIDLAAKLEEIIKQFMVSDAAMSLNRMVSLAYNQTGLNLDGSWIEKLKLALIDLEDPGELKNLMTTLRCFRTQDRVRIAENKDYIDTNGACLQKNRLLLGAFQYTNLDKNLGLPNLIKYTLYMDPHLMESTNLGKFEWTVDMKSTFPGEMKHLAYGFSYLQGVMDSILIKMITNSTDVIPYMTQQFPQPCWLEDKFPLGILGLSIAIGWMLLSLMIVKDIVLEKEHRLKEVMKVMGLTNTVYWSSWFLSGLILALISITSMSVLVVLFKLAQPSTAAVLFGYLILYTLATIALCILMSTFFARANLAACCAVLLFFLFQMPYLIFKRAPLIIKLASCLLSNTAFMHGIEYMVEFEKIGEPVAKNLLKSPYPGDEFNFLMTCGMLLADTFLYFLIAWYIENVFPGDYGIPRPLYFFLLRSYWCKTSEPVTTECSEQSVDDSECLIEHDERKHTVGVSVQGLKKVYSDGKVAVNNLSLDFYENQITSFLGHNGAGKTTTLSVILGTFPPNKGTVKIYGKDVRTDMSEIRESLGMCPQHNVLFDDFTVKDQLFFYAALKRIPKHDQETEVNKMLYEVGLPDKANTQAKKLSGGMKRKLSIAVALIGGSKTVILDEPTAGVDPQARRSIWDLLLRHKHGRTIILSTHHMDEADILGDRIAIISQGKLLCCGSSLFLKKSYGSGYCLSMTRSEDGRKAPSQISSTTRSATGATESTPTSGSASLEDFVKRHLPNAHMVSQVGHELVFNIPRKNVYLLGSFFKIFDKRLKVFGIASYGISDTSLEEVFLKVIENEPFTTDSGFERKICGCIPIKQKVDESVGSEPEVSKPSRSVTPADDGMNVELGIDKSDSSNLESVKQVNPYWLLRRQFGALVVKRFHHFKRSKKGAFAEIILPAVFIAIAGIVSFMAEKKYVHEPPLVLSPYIYTKSNQIFYSTAEPHGYVDAKRIIAQLATEPGVGLRCMSGNPWDYKCRKSEKPTKSTPGKTTGYDTKGMCSCSTGRQTCNEDPYEKGPKGWKAKTGDQMIDVTNWNITDWLMTANRQNNGKLFGGFSIPDQEIPTNITLKKLDDFLHLPNLKKFIKQYLNLSLTGNEAEIWHRLLINRPSVVKLWYDNRAQFALPIYTNILSNALLRASLKNDTDPVYYGIETTAHPVKYTKKEAEDKESVKNNKATTSFITPIILAFSIIPASFVLFLIDERVNESKHLQFVSGVRPWLYWAATLTWDMTNFCIPILLTFVVLVCFGETSFFHSGQSAVGALLLFLLYGFSIIPLMYPFSWVFSVPSYAMSLLIFLNFLISFATMLSIQLLSAAAIANNTLRKTKDVLAKVFLIFPQYCLASGIKVLHERTPNALAWDHLGQYLLSMLVLGVTMLLLVLIIEYNMCDFLCFCRKWGQTPVKDDAEDTDVTRERDRVEALDVVSDDAIVHCVDLTKTYCTGLKSKIHAVKDLTFAIPRGQCFGLLGVNGAGKSSTFHMLTGKHVITRGSAALLGFNIATDRSKAFKSIGFCPQFDALNKNLTARELLAFYAKLRGFPENELGSIVEQAIKQMQLVQCADRPSGKYSGGNKRKLSTAIALIGDPEVVLLDEPTAGMDPKARRFLWNRILEVIHQNRSVILTSHSMEECEALCGRIAIMVSGRFMCIGSIQHLKSRFGQGYTLSFKMHVAAGTKHMSTTDNDGSENASTVDEACAYFAAKFQGTEVKERHYNMAQLQLPGHVSVGEVFTCLEESRKKFNIEDYSVTQTTLDQVFIRFAEMGAQQDRKEGLE